MARVELKMRGRDVTSKRKVILMRCLGDCICARARRTGKEAWNASDCEEETTLVLVALD